MKIIKERTVRTEKSFSLNFDLVGQPYCGFSFPCDREGNVFPDLNDCAMDNYRKCLADTSGKYEQPYIDVQTYRIVEPAVGQCACGAHVLLEDQYMGACQCDNCGQWYNIYGQALIDPEYWED